MGVQPREGTENLWPLILKYSYKNKEYDPKINFAPTLLDHLLNVGARGRAGLRPIRVRAYNIILYLTDLEVQNTGTARVD